MKVKDMPKAFGWGCALVLWLFLSWRIMVQLGGL